ncbi:MAG TPA: ABC transporter permease [Chloroflexi bacterium]|nr:ABC transporter permease [Chloroflexota bacterium]
MSTEVQPLVNAEATPKKKSSSGSLRILQYIGFRLVLLFLTVVVGVYLTILIANMGGFVDQIMRGQIRERITLQVQMNRTYDTLTPEARSKLTSEMIAVEEDRLGLNQPFAIRSFRYLKNALTLDLGRSLNMTSDTGSKQVRLIILERLPPTLVLFGASNLLLFFSSLYIALALSRKYGSFMDKLLIGLSPLSSVPAWFYGIFLILIFAAMLRWLPFGGMVDAPPPETTIGYILSLLKHMILPVFAWMLSSIFLNIYGWRTFFLIYSSEDYVEMAKMKGVTDRELERKYILRPTLPNIITAFAFVLIGLWGGAIITETVFNWPGLGQAYYHAVGLYDTPVVVGITVIYAYLYALTFFFLDFIYALVDPRVKVGSSGN